MAGSGILYKTMSMVSDGKRAFKMAFIKNPCKKCLVRACCQVMCTDKQYQRKVMYPFNFGEGKFISWIFVSTLCSAAFLMIFLTIKTCIIFS